MDGDGGPLAAAHRHCWREILIKLGVPAQMLVKRHGPCPMCGGKDRFRFDDKGGLGTFICSRCGAGDGPRLLMLFLGLNFTDTMKRVHSVAGTPPRPRRQAVDVAPGRTPKVRPGRSQRLIEAIWDNSLTAVEPDPVGRYLVGRLGRMPSGTGLRYDPACRDLDRNERDAMIAMYLAPDGAPTAIHRTFLTTAGRKASLKQPKASLGTLVGGGAVRLAPAGAVLGIAEGIETALAASIIFDVPVWAALNANRLAVWQPPEGVEEVVVFADNDQNFVGQRAAFDLQARLSGRLRVSIEMPVEQGTDWCDEVIVTSGSGSIYRRDRSSRRQSQSTL